MQINIKTSEKNKDVVQRLTRKLLPAGTAENVIARIALSYSLAQDKVFSTSEFNNYDSKGKEYKEHILFDSAYKDFYVALICQKYDLYKTNDDIPRYIKLHIDHGLELLDKIFETNPTLSFVDFLTENMEKGIAYLTDVDTSFTSVKNSQQKFEKAHFTGNIKLEVGKSLESNESIYLDFNGPTYNNNHISVAGISGSGKTQFALDLISQICDKSNGQVNYIYLDFKGLKGDDVKGMEAFFTTTRTEFIDVPQTPFPVNPLSFIDNINEKNKIAGIDKFVDIVGKYSNLGIKQKGILRDATKKAFQNVRNGNYPTLAQINEHVLDIVGDKRDSLTEIVDALCRYSVFDDKETDSAKFISKNIYLSLSGDLSDDVRFTSLFLIINQIYNIFMNMENSPREEGIQAMRYVIMIDEAHVIFREKKYQEILDKMLREIRSKGVSIILLSQGIEEFCQSKVDFSSNCQISFLMNISNKDSKMMEKFLGVSGKESLTLAKSMEKIAKGQAVSNLKEEGFKVAERFNVSQFYKRK